MAPFEYFSWVDSYRYMNRQDLLEGRHCYVYITLSIALVKSGTPIHWSSMCIHGADAYPCSGPPRTLEVQAEEDHNSDVMVLRCNSWKSSISESPGMHLECRFLGSTLEESDLMSLREGPGIWLWQALQKGETHQSCHVDSFRNKAVDWFSV